MGILQNITILTHGKWCGVGGGGGGVAQPVGQAGEAPA
jgi:hypothetical protein